MTRSSPPPWNIDDGTPRNERDAPEAVANRPARGRRPGLKLGSFVRWLHTYLSMFGLAALLFFGLTGITLNHPRLFFDGVAATVEAKGQVDVDWVKDEGSSDPESEIRKLEVVEHLRKTHGLRGALASFTADEEECAVTFKGPGYSADVFIRRSDGRYRVSEERLGVVAVLNDLHKGRDTGPVWSAVIDISAGLTALASLTGLILLLYVKRRRASGLLLALVGAGLLLAAFLLGVG